MCDLMEPITIATIKTSVQVLFSKNVFSGYVHSLEEAACFHLILGKFA